jgi:hypothetical protein
VQQLAGVGAGRDDADMHVVREGPHVLRREPRPLARSALAPLLWLCRAGWPDRKLSSSPTRKLS